MVYGAVALLFIDLALMGGILYIFASKKTKLSRAFESEFPEGMKPVITEMKEELKAAKNAAARLKEKELEIAAFEKMLQDRHKKIETIIKEAEESFKNNALLYSSHMTDDIYAKAMKLLKMGAPADEIIKKLGLLNGELELISSLNNYRA